MAWSHRFQHARKLFAAVGAALLATGLSVRNSPSPFTADAEAASPAPGSPLREADRKAHYAHWFILMRWIAVVVAGVLVVFAIGVFALLPRMLWGPLTLTIAVLALLNGTYLWLLRSGRTPRFLLPVQAYGDLLILIVLLHYSGGVENPLAPLMLFHVIIAGIILSRRQCYLVAAAASALFLLLAWAEWAGVVEHYTLSVFPHFTVGHVAVHAAHDPSYVVSRTVLQAVILFLTAYFTTTITDQLRRDERQLEVFADQVLAQSQLLERALETTGTALCVCDQDLRRSWSNGRWQAWFGERPPGAELPAASTLADGQVRTAEVADAAEGRIVQLTTAPLLGLDGAATHLVQLARDVTEQKRMQERMVRAERLAAVGELAGKVAHEVNNPIAIISAKTRLLLSDHRDQLSEKTAAELVKITDLADRVARIARGLLSYCRPAPGPAATLDLRIPIRKALAMVEAPATAAGVQIRDDLPAALPAVRANAGELEQVFLNLFLNAVDAMPQGGQLVVSARRQAEPRAEAPPRLLVVVEDTGGGIPAEIRERVFEPFLTTKAEGRGTGLGLSICLGLVRSNGGEIELSSEPGLGTSVQLRFPTVEPQPEEGRHA